MKDESFTESENNEPLSESDEDYDDEKEERLPRAAMVAFGEAQGNNLRIKN